MGTVDVVTTTLATNPVLRRRVLTLAWLTVVWNVIEAVVAIVAGRAAGSLALVGFGLDSTIEVASAAVIIWQFAGADEEREQQALRLIALSFFALAAYVIVQAGFDLAAGNEPESSVVGIVLAIVSLIVMPILAVAKRSTGRQIGSVTVTADSQQTMLCTYLSVVLLVGLVLNATLNWWWADPAAALIIAALALREGRQAWRGDNCCG
jgi:divalent metal cation (Fe/Co/Zn/Cd) transporter